MTVTPTSSLTRRVAEQGRIRFGVRTASGAPKAIQTFRFTSSDRQAIDAVAKLYGGTVKAWAPSKGRSEWEVITESNEVSVFLPPDPLGNTPVYELWSGGGLVRRCNGEACELILSSPEGAHIDERPCICAAKNEMACSVTTRLTVVLPDIRPFGGGWRLETKGWNAAHELPGMVEMIQALQAKGLTRAVLALEKRTKVAGGKTRHFTVPLLKIPATAEEILGGHSSIEGPKMAEIEASVVLDEVIDVEEVPAPDEGTAKLLEQIVELMNGTDLPHEALTGFRLLVTDGEVRAPTADELRRLRDGIEKIVNGEAIYIGLDATGKAKVKRA